MTCNRAGEIKKITEKLPATGTNASPRFTRDSLVKLTGNAEDQLAMPAKPKKPFPRICR